MPRRGGWRRRGSKGRFRYEDARGNRITDPDRIERIESLVIPPAWKDVWISPNPRAKLQATGIDAAGRRQYLYHPDFRAQQEQAKFDKLIRFAEKLPESARRDGPGHGARGARARAGGGGRRPADQPRLVPRRLGALREAPPHVRDHDADEEARDRARQPDRVQVQGQAQRPDPDRDRRRRARADVARPARASGRPPAVPLRVRGRCSCRSTGASSTTTSASTWARSSRRRTSAPGAAR